jgi:hypothetical protein
VPLTIDPVLGTDLGDRSVWARSIVDEQRRNRKSIPGKVDLEQAIENLTIGDTIRGSSTIVVTVYDEDWSLCDSGFFDANGDGKLDKIDVNYPEGGRFWWRLAQVGIDGSRGGAELTLTFMERAVMQLMQHRGPLKVRRSKKTRAEFLKQLVDTVGKHSNARPIKFYSKELHVEQPLAGKTKEDRSKERDERKLGGLTPDPDLRIKGQQASQEQLQEVERSLDVASRRHAPDQAVIGMLCAGIGESGFRVIMNTSGSSYGGVFQGNVAGGVFEIDDTEGMADSFLMGGRGFQAGGAIALVRSGVTDPGEIATRVEASGQPASFYGVYEDEAKRLLEAYGGVDGGGSTYTKAYHFTVGGPNNPHENFWDAMTRLADEVKWALFMDGQRCYFDDEMRLVQQKPAMTLRRGGEAVVSFRANWDSRRIATEAEIDLICDPFEFRAGQVVLLKGFGAASTGSTAKLPGRWLIEEINRERFNLYSTFKLKQPEDPAPEPRPQTGTRKDDPYDVTGPIRKRIIEIAESTLSTKTGFNRYSQAGALTDDPTPSVPNRTDCSQWIYACYKRAGAPSPGTNTYQMESMSRRTNQPQPGDLLLGPGHVELYVGGGRTIGHGTPPIDYSDVNYWKAKGFWFATYDFLDQDDPEKPPGSIAGGGKRPNN